MGRLPFLSLVRPFLPILPEVPSPDRYVSWREQVLWTVGVALILLFCTEFPLFGIRVGYNHWMRPTFTTNGRTLMDLGIAPTLISQMVMQMLVFAKLIEVNFSLQEHRALFHGAQKLFALILSLGLATVRVLTGFYGDPGDLGAGICLLLIVQLCSASIMALFLDEVTEKGYGLSHRSGISVYIVTKHCESVFWGAFSPITLNTSRGPQFQGAVLAFVHLLCTRNDKGRALREAFWREELPNMMNLMVTIAVYHGMIFLHMLRVEIPVKRTIHAGMRGTYPKRLFDMSHMPFQLEGMLMSYVFYISQMLAESYPDTIPVRLLGVWEPLRNGQLVAMSGMAYYMSPPHTMKSALLDPVRTLMFIAFKVTVCAICSTTWMAANGRTPRDVVMQLKDQHIVCIDHHGERVSYKELEHVISTADALGCALLGLLSVVVDWMGAFGSGIDISAVVGLILSYSEVRVGPGLPGFFENEMQQ